MRGFTSQQPSRPTTTRIRLFGNLLVLKTLTSQKNDADALRNAHRRRATSRQLLQRNPDLIGQYNRWRNTHIEASPCYEMTSTNNRLYLWRTTLAKPIHRAELLDLASAMFSPSGLDDLSLPA